MPETFHLMSDKFRPKVISDVGEVRISAASNSRFCFPSLAIASRASDFYRLTFLLKLFILLNIDTPPLATR
jgi:hypothetical protein